MAKVACFDTETTGVSKEQDTLLQITIVDENCNILLETYIKPKDRESWINAEQVNHISPDMVKDAPTALEIAPLVQKIFDEADVITGYNVGFDVGFVEKDCKITIDRTKVVDCLKVFKDECKKKNINLSRHKLGNAVDFYCPEAKADYLANAHDASCDAIATMKVYEAQVDKERKRHYEKVTSLTDSAKELLAKLYKPKEEEQETEVEKEEEDELEL